MKATGHKSLIASVIMAFLFILIGAGCEITPKQKADAEYLNGEVSYADKETCVERYLLYEENARYERYIAGDYFGHHVPGIRYGTLFETGYYELDDTKEKSNITFYPKKRYDFDTEDLESLGIPNQIPYSATITDATLTITWTVWVGHHDKREVPIVYQRQ